MSVPAILVPILCLSVHAVPSSKSTTSSATTALSALALAQSTPPTATSAVAKEVPEWLASRRKSGLDALVNDLTKGSAKDERVVLFGRAAYGTRETVELERMLATLADRFEVIAADVGLLEGMAVDTFLATGEGDLDAIVASLVPWGWSTPEVKATLQALRAAPKKPRFHGIGFGSPVKLIEIASEFWDKVSYGAGTRAANMAGPLHALLPDGRPRYLILDPTERYLVQVGVSEMNTILQDQMEDYTAKSSKAEYEYAASCAERLFQTLETLRMTVDAGEHDPRGRFLASNLHKIVQSSEKSARVLALVHVRDLARGSDADSMAKQWETLFGAPAFSIGSAFLEARVRAFQPIPVDAKGPLEFALDKAARTPLEALLAALPAGVGVIDTTGALKEGPVAKWLGERLLLRSAREALGGVSEAPWDFSIALDFDRLVVFPSLSLSTPVSSK